MVKIGGEFLNKEYIRQRVGDMQQIAGIRKMQFDEGRAKNTTTFEVNTGAGLSYSVLADRGLDIAFARYKDNNFSYLSKTGISGPAFYVENGVNGFLRVFHAGLLTTCGYTYMGAPSQVGDKKYGLHGRATGIPAEELNYSTKWQNDEYVLEIEGKMRESIVFGENIVLNRKITSFAGRNIIKIVDTFINEGYIDTPLMLLYHFNFGFPFLSERTEIFIPSKMTIQYNEQAGKSDYRKVEVPQKGYSEKVFYHDLKTIEDNITMAGVYSAVGSDALGILIKYNKKQLPVLTQWKQMGLQDYVLGIEPGTNKTLGVAKAKESEEIIMLVPGEERTNELEIEIITQRSQWEKMIGIFD